MTRFQLLLTAMLLTSLSAVSHAIPSTLSVSGQLFDADGEPLIFTETHVDPSTSDTYEIAIEKTLDARLRFYTSETVETVTASIDTIAKSENGFFKIYYEPPQSLLTLDEVYFDLAIDVDEDGIGPEDLFQDRFRMASVPFAMAGSPNSFVSVFEGYNFRSFPIVSHLKKIHVAPFQTSGGGFRFDRMYTYIELSPNAAFKLGIYDASGSLVVSTDLAASHDTTFQGYLEFIVPTTKLLPSRMYFFALDVGSTNPNVTESTSVNDSPQFGSRVTITPDILLAGSISFPVPVTDLPVEINPNNIVSGYDSYIPTLTLALSTDKIISDITKKSRSPRSTPTVIYHPVDIPPSNPSAPQ